MDTENSDGACASKGSNAEPADSHQLNYAEVTILLILNDLMLAERVGFVIDGVGWTGKRVGTH